MTRILLALFLGLASSVVLPALAQEQEKRLALVIGNGAYEAGALQTAANDAGLVAQTLQAAGFDVIGARDLDGETLRKSFRDFVQKVQEAGPNTVAFVYLAGYGVQLTGENYFVPVDARIVRDTDVPVEGIRLSDYMRQLSALQLKANVIVLDAARANPFAKEGQPLAGGLALVEPDAKMLVAFNAAPGTVAPEGAPPYGAYAQALAEMIRAGGLSLPEVFDRVRLRVSDMTKGAPTAVGCAKDRHFLRVLRAPAGCAAGPARCQPARQADPRLRRQGCLRRGARARHAAGLRRLPAGVPERSVGQARARNCRCAARGDRLAADLSHRYAAGLLVVPRSLSARSARRRCAAPSGHSLGGAGAAAVLCGDRVRRTAATARRNCLHRSPGALFRRSGVRLRAATTPAGLLPAAAGAGVRGAAATAAADRRVRAAGAGVRGDTGLLQAAGLCQAAAEQHHLRQHPQQEPSSTTSSTIAIPRRRSSLAGQREQAASRLPRPRPRWRRRCRPPRHSEPIWSSRRHNRAAVNQVLNQVLAASRQRRPRQRPRRARRPMPPQHGPIPPLPASPRRLPPVRMRCRAPMDNRCQRLRPRPPRRRRRMQPYLRAQEPLHHQLPSP